MSDSNRKPIIAQAVSDYIRSISFPDKHQIHTVIDQMTEVIHRTGSITVRDALYILDNTLPAELEPYMDYIWRAHSYWYIVPVAGERNTGTENIPYSMETVRYALRIEPPELAEYLICSKDVTKYSATEKLALPKSQPDTYSGNYVVSDKDTAMHNAYDILKKYIDGSEDNAGYVIETALGFLGQALS